MNLDNLTAEELNVVLRKLNDNKPSASKDYLSWLRNYKAREVIKKVIREKVQFEPVDKTIESYLE
jgi:hypothetical protein